MRLTYNSGFGFYEIKPDVGEEAKAQQWNYYDAINKLGQLEDIEEKLGIGLLTLLRVQTTGAYFKGKDRKWIPMTDYNEKCFKLMETEIYRFYFKDYGKTWALTKEELE